GRGQNRAGRDAQPRDFAHGRPCNRTQQRANHPRRRAARWQSARPRVELVAKAVILMNLRLYLRWTWRDLRARWLQVIAIALIIALGTGVHAGLSSMADWRYTSYDASYALLNMYDLRVRLTEGSYVDAETLLDTLDDLPHAHWITAAEPRLILPTLVETGDPSDPILVPGRIIGVDISD